MLVRFLGFEINFSVVLDEGARSCSCIYFGRYSREFDVRQCWCGLDPDGSYGVITKLLLSMPGSAGILPDPKKGLAQCRTWRV